MSLTRWRDYTHRFIAKEVSQLTRYYNRLIYWLPRTHDNRQLFTHLEAPEKVIIEEGEPFPDLNKTSDPEARTAILLNGVLNHCFDIAGLLKNIYPKLNRHARILLIIYNPYLSYLYKLANLLGIRQGPVPTTFITRLDLANLAKLSGYQIIRSRTAIYFPWRLWGLGHVINRLCAIIPGVRWLSFAYLVYLRPIKAIAHDTPKPSLAIVIPARNEAGNIENAIKKLPRFPAPIEIIYVEGHSTDNTWVEIQRVAALYQNNPHYTITILQQTGKGKADAVRLGFAHARSTLLTILDADLTMPPEKLMDFYEAYCNGLGDFINGSRLLYPMEGEAMRPLNHWGNKAFSMALSYVLDINLSDTLCGTKLFSRADYERMQTWRKDFGDFDPFGDFELLFPAATLGLGTIDIPIRYLARTYGQTNIARFTDGLKLLKMTLIGFYKIKLGKG